MDAFRENIQRLADEIRGEARKPETESRLELIALLAAQLTERVRFRLKNAGA